MATGIGDRRAMPVPERQHLPWRPQGWHGSRTDTCRSAAGDSLCRSSQKATRVPHVSRKKILTPWRDRKSTRLNSSHGSISYAVFCLKKKKHIKQVRAGGCVGRVTGIREVLQMAEECSIVQRCRRGDGHSAAI